MGEVGDDASNFEWTVSDLDRLNDGKQVILSDVFQGGPFTKHQWRLELSKYEQHPNLVHVYLLLVQLGDNDVSDTRRVKVKVTAEASGREGWEPKFPSSDYYDFGAYDDSKKLVNVFSHPEASTLHFKCTVCIKVNFWDMRNSSPVEKALLDHLNLRSQRITAMMSETEFADLVITSGDGKSFKVHKVVMAVHSNVFKAMLKSKLKETQDNEVHIADFKGDTIEAMIEYIYHGKTASMNDKATELVMLADKYELLEMKKDCENSIVRYLDEDTFTLVVMIASQINSVKLRSACIGYFSQNKAKLLKLPSVKKFFRKHPNSLMDILS